MKKIVLFLLLFTSLFFISACGSAKSPKISNPNDNYLTAKEGTYTYTVKNSKVYEMLKENVGYSVLIDMIDRDILKEEKKDGVSYWNQVTEDEILEAVEKDSFPNGKEDLTEEEIEEQEVKFYNTLFTEYGLNSKEEVKEYYRLSIAREKYATDQKYAEVEAEDFKDSEYDNYFKANFKDGYHAIVISFTTYRMLENALLQLGYSLVKDEVLKDGNALTNNEAIMMFIELYNMVNITKVENYPTYTKMLNEGVEYTLEGSKIVFDLEKIDFLHYTNSEITSYESAIQKELAKFNNYTEEDNFYTKKIKVYKSGARHSLYMKIAQETFDFEDKKAEIKETLINQKITSSYINTQLIKLRFAYGVTFYDTTFIDSYISDLAGAEIEHKKFKSNSGSLVAKSSLKEYTADELFAAMDKNYGISIAISEMEFNRFVYNLEFNDVYDFLGKNILESTRWEILQQAIKDEKKSFKSNLYEEEGYPSKIGWSTFIKEVYGASSDQELERFFVFQEVIDRYSKTLGALKGSTETSDLWVFYKEKMQEMVDNYFEVVGVHLLISVRDSANKPIDPKEWTETQNEYAKEFYAQVMAYLNDETKTDTAKKKLENIQNAFNKAPYFVTDLPQNSAEQPVVEGMSYSFEGIELSKFKSAGLQASFEDLETFKNGVMVTEFNDAVKSIWDANSDSKEVVIYDSKPEEGEDFEYLVTIFGYHVYVNLETKPIAEYAAGLVIPDLESAIEYIKSNDSTSLTTKMKAALKNYFSPIYTELVSKNNLQIISYEAMAEFEITLSNSNYSVGDLKRFLNLTSENRKAGLKYKK